MNSYFKHLATCFLVVGCLFNIDLTAQNVLQTGTVKFAIASKVSPDTGWQSVYFKPGYGAALMLNPSDSSGFQSIYAFDKDSVYHFLRSEKLVVLPVMSIKETLAMSKRKMSFKVTIGKKTKDILGYSCFDFKAVSGSGKRKTVITGWATRQIQNKMAVVMDQDLLSIGFPMEFTMLANGASKKEGVVFSATQVTNQVDDQIFVHPK